MLNHEYTKLDINKIFYFCPKNYFFVKPTVLSAWNQQYLKYQITLGIFLRTDVLYFKLWSIRG